MRKIVPLVVLVCGLAACADDPISPSGQAIAPQFGVAAGQRVPLRIESWLHRQVGGNPFVTGSVTSCAKVWIGDELFLSGTPAWDAASYASLPADAALRPAAAAGKCEPGTWGDVGGYEMHGQGRFQDDHLGQLDNMLWARHNIVLPGGSIDIQFEARYDGTFFTPPPCKWVITGGTGDFAGLQGNGDCQAQGYAVAATDWGNWSTWDVYFVHTEWGTAHWTGPEK